MTDTVFFVSLFSGFMGAAVDGGMLNLSLFHCDVAFFFIVLIVLRVFGFLILGFENYGI